MPLKWYRIIHNNNTSMSHTHCVAARAVTHESTRKRGWPAVSLLTHAAVPWPMPLSTRKGEWPAVCSLARSAFPDPHCCQSTRNGKMTSSAFPDPHRCPYTHAVVNQQQNDPGHCDLWIHRERRTTSRRLLTHGAVRAVTECGRQQWSCCFSRSVSTACQALPPCLRTDWPDAAGTSPGMAFQPDSTNM